MVKINIHISQYQLKHFCNYYYISQYGKCVQNNVKNTQNYVLMLCITLEKIFTCKKQCKLLILLVFNENVVCNNVCTMCNHDTIPFKNQYTVKLDYHSTLLAYIKNKEISRLNVGGGSTLYRKLILRTHTKHTHTLEGGHHNRFYKVLVFHFSKWLRAI